MRGSRSSQLNAPGHVSLWPPPRARMRSERDQLGQIRPLAVELGADQSARLVTADDPQVVCRRAERQLQRRVAQDHEAISAMIMSGPLEDLADVVLAVELIGRRVGQAPALTVTTEVTQCKEVTRRAMAGKDCRSRR